MEIIYPNPLTGDILYIGKLPEGVTKVNVSIVTPDGQICRMESMTNYSSGPVTFHTGKLAPGMYWLRIAGKGGKLLKTYKFIKL